MMLEDIDARLRSAVDLSEGDEFEWTCRLAQYLLKDQQDLMHKACGWMLREMGKRDEAVLCHFHNKHAYSMPRTMLRYAIERLSEEKRRNYMNKKRIKVSKC